MKPDKNIKRMRGKFDNLPDKQSASNLTRKRIQACTKNIWNILSVPGKNR